MDKIKEQILDLLIEHSRAVYSIVSDMGVFYQNWVDSSKSSKAILENKVSKLYLDIEEATSIKNRIIKEFSEAFSLGAGDWAILTQKMHNLSNLAFKFVNILEHVDLSVIDSEMKKRYHKSINSILEMVNLLKSSIKLLRENPDSIIYNLNEIHELGNSTDLMLHDFLYYLYKDKDLEIRNLLVIRDNVVALEHYIDKIYSIAEIIRMLHYE